MGEGRRHAASLPGVTAQCIRIVRAATAGLAIRRQASGPAALNHRGTAQQSRNQRTDDRASEGILKPQMNADERRWIEVNAASLPDQATIAFILR
jgi:hypothetical protein